MATGAITERVRRAILAAAGQMDFDATMLLDRHARAESLADAHDVVDDVEERYGLEPESLLSDPASQLRLGRTPPGEFVLSRSVRAEAYAEAVLYALPDAEFVAVIEHAVADSAPSYVTGSDDLADAAGKILAAHGCAFHRELGNWPHFAWVGDPKQHELVVEPALRALADNRLAGARTEFEEALHKRRLGAPKDLGHAIDEAAKSVESILQILHHELGVPLPPRRQLSSLFSNLIEKGPAGRIPPGYVDHLVLAAGGPRNLTSHGQGATVREVPEELADASIAAAATAITLLAHYLP